MILALYRRRFLIGAIATASLGLPSVQAAIKEGRPLIASMQQVAETTPLGGHGLTAT